MSKTIWEHLMDFKNVIFKLLLTWVVFTIATAFFSDEINQLITRPLNGQTIHFLSPTDSIMYLFKIHLFFGFIISLPFLTLIIWQYIHSALESKERRFLLFYVFSVLILAMLGLVYSYFSILPISLEFLLGINPAGTQTMITAETYTNFLISSLLILILVFQTPILIFGLIKSRLVRPDLFTKNRKYMYFILVVVMAILTPPDVFSLLLTIIPVAVFLESSIWLASLGLKTKENNSV